MKILQINTHENLGGAAIAAGRLHLALLAAGIDSRMAVGVRHGDTPNTLLVGGKFARRIVRPLALHLERALPAMFHATPEYPSHTSFSLHPSLQHRRVNAIDRDILHLHWLGDSFVPPWALGRLRGPAVWTIHDTWPFTGGCHYTLSGCERYLDRCGRCPELCGSGENDFSRWHWRQKRRAIERLRPILVSPSREYARKAAASGLLAGCRVEHIPNCIDTDLFRPIDKGVARRILRLPETTPIVMLGATSITDRHKGIDLALDALQRVAANLDGASFVCAGFGSGRPPENPPFPVISLGRLSDQITLTLAYSAADIFVCPSREDNLPNTVLESLACGTPVVGFAVGGIPDMLKHGVNGYLAAPRNMEDFAAGIAVLLGNPDLRRRMGDAGREKVEKDFSFPVIARKHIALYEDILEKQMKHPRRT